MLHAVNSSLSRGTPTFHRSIHLEIPKPNSAWKLATFFLFLYVLAISVSLAAAQSDTPEPFGPNQVGQGCLMYRSPISGAYETIPLTHTDVAFDVRGLVASATVTQQYVNSSTTPIEAVYVFPLPHDSAIYDLEIRIGNRIIRSEIHEREEAKRIYQTAKDDGKRAALLEQERPNIFTASVANIMPNDHIDVRLRLVEPLQWEAGKMRLTFPMVVGPRYIPGTQAVGHEGAGWASDTNAVPDASRITPIIHNPQARPHDISITVDLDSGFGGANITSPSHQIQVTPATNGKQRVELSASTTLPNKDFILQVEQPTSLHPQTALFLSPGNDTGETQFLLATYPPTVQPNERGPVEMQYVIDVSGSMQGTSIEQARSALLQALDRLRPIDRFGILVFNHSYREFAPVTLQATSENLAAARDYVRNLQAGGGTEMLPALMHVMTKPQTPGTARHIILMTDGDLGNEDQIFSALRANLNGARLYTIAIGSAPNLYLAGKMAQFGNGTCTHIADIHEIESQMTHLFSSIESPVLTNVNLSFDGVETADMYPSHLPDLFIGQPLLVYGRITSGKAGTLHLTGRAGDQPYESTIVFDTTKATFHAGITTLWARQRVEEWMDQYREAPADEQPQLKSAIIAHAIRYRLVTRFTSLVAVEQVIVNNGGNSQTVAVPTEFPDGWKMEGVFGVPATGTADTFFELLGALLLCLGLILLWLIRKADQSA
jgi:Ca-activated chloride channel family protein